MGGCHGQSNLSWPTMRLVAKRRKCGMGTEINAIADSRLSEADLPATTMTTIRQVPPTNKLAGRIGESCDVCKYLMSKLGIDWTWGPRW
jgi:hypothetical protein